MLKTFRTSDFRSLFIASHHPDPRYHTEYRNAFDVWRSVWTRVYGELNQSAPPYSDHFTRQDEVGGIFFQQQCIGLVLYRWVRTDLIDYATDSYFKVWTSDDIQKLTQYGNLILVPSFLTVHDEWKRLPNGVQTKKLLMDFMVRRFLDSQAVAMASTTRNQKGIQKVAYELGAVPIRQNVAHFSEADPVDLVATYRHTAKTLSEPAVASFAEELWQARTYVGRFDEIDTRATGTSERAA